MIDISQYKAGFLKEKKEDIDSLQGIDYAAMKNKAGSAFASGSAQQIIEAVAEIDSYDHRVNRKNRSTVPIPHLDQAIQSCVDKYSAIQAGLKEGIENYLQNTKNEFNREYQAKAPQICKLRKISEDYFLFEGKIAGLDEVILKYSRFSKELKAVEAEITSTVADYKNASGKADLNAIEQRVRQAGKKIEKIKSKAPKAGIFGIRGLHKAYDYKNSTLTQLDLELICFEKKGFAQKRQKAVQEIDEANDLIEYLQCANEEEIFTVFEEYSKADFSDMISFAGTVYFGEIAKEHARTVKQAREIAKERAVSYQDQFKKKLQLHTLFHVADNQSTSDLKEQERILREEYGQMVDIICGITGNSDLRKDLDAGLKYAADRISEVKESNAAKKAAAEEVAKAKACLEETKNALESEKKQYTAKEKDSKAQLKRLTEEKAAIACSLDAEKKTKEDLQKKVDDALGRYAQITKQIEANKAALAKELASQVDQKLQRVEARLAEEAKKRAETDQQFRAHFSSMASMVNQKVESLSSESTARVTEIYQELRDAITHRPNITPEQVNDMLLPIYSRLDELKDISTVQKRSIMDFIIDKLNLRKKESNKEQSQKISVALIQPTIINSPDTEKIEEIDIDQLFREKQRWKEERNLVSVDVPDIDLDQLMREKYKGIHCRNY